MGGRGKVPAAKILLMSPGADECVEGTLDPSPGRRSVSRGTSPGYPASTSRPDLMIGIDPDDDDGFNFGVEGSLVEDDEVVLISLVAIGFDGEVAFVMGDSEVKVDAGLSVELPELDRSLGTGEFLF